MTTRPDRLLGCLIGGACGDALGAPVEFLQWPAIRAKYGEGGIRGLEDVPGVAHFTDDTQMSLFTVEGLLRGRHATNPVASVHEAYLRWFATQGERPPLPIARDGWLFGIEALHRRRAPGNTCLDALRNARAVGEMARNDSKGCGGVMRVAACGFWPGSLAQRFDLAADCARLTHGHVTGYLSSGCLAAVIGGVVDGMPLSGALDAAQAILADRAGHEETTRFVASARQAAESGPSRATLATLGRGWVAEEALAIALYCVLAEPDPVAAMVLAVNHDGDSDSTGAIAGNLLGALLGRAWLPDAWLGKLELRAEIERLGLEFAEAVAGAAAPTAVPSKR